MAKWAAALSMPPAAPAASSGFEELPDGRNHIVLVGVSRFRIASEEAEQRGYRRIRPDWSAYTKDFDPPQGLGIERENAEDQNSAAILICTICPATGTSLTTPPMTCSSPACR